MEDEKVLDASELSKLCSETLSLLNKYLDLKATPAEVERLVENTKILLGMYDILKAQKQRYENLAEWYRTFLRNYHKKIQNEEEKQILFRSAADSLKTLKIKVEKIENQLKMLEEVLKYLEIWKN